MARSLSVSLSLDTCSRCPFFRPPEAPSFCLAEILGAGSSEPEKSEPGSLYDTCFFCLEVGAWGDEARASFCVQSSTRHNAAAEEAARLLLCSSCLLPLRRRPRRPLNVAVGLHGHRSGKYSAYRRPKKGAFQNSSLITARAHVVHGQYLLLRIRHRVGSSESHNCVVLQSCSHTEPALSCRDPL